MRQNRKYETKLEVRAKNKKNDRETTIKNNLTQLFVLIL